MFVFIGEWMNNSAGMAFAPHVITIGVGGGMLHTFKLLRHLKYDAHIEFTKFL